MSAVVGRIPQKASVGDLHWYFGNFGTVVDMYVPKDVRSSGHKGFGFVTFAEDGVADRVSRRSHEILGQKKALDKQILNNERLLLELELSVRVLFGMKPYLMSAAISPVFSMSLRFDLSTLVSLGEHGLGFYNDCFVGLEYFCG